MYNHSCSRLKVHRQIFSHLFPKDLLHLARTSKDLRAMLMSRSTVSVWKAARSNVLPIMPDCYPNMSEPEYTHFAFAEFCHVRKMMFLLWCFSLLIPLHTIVLQSIVERSRRCCPMDCSKNYMPKLLAHVVSVLSLPCDVATAVLIRSSLRFSCKSATDWNDTKKIPEAVSIGKVFRGFDFREIVPCLGYNPNAGRECA